MSWFILINYSWWPPWSHDTWWSDSFLNSVFLSWMFDQQIFVKTGAQCQLDNTAAPFLPLTQESSHDMIFTQKIETSVKQICSDVFRPVNPGKEDLFLHHLSSLYRLWLNSFSLPLYSSTYKTVQMYMWETGFPLLLLTEQTQGHMTQNWRPQTDQTEFFSFNEWCLLVFWNVWYVFIFYFVLVYVIWRASLTPLHLHASGWNAKENKSFSG